MANIRNLDAIDDATHTELFDGSAPRVVRLHLESGAEVPAHRHPGTTIVFHLRAGRLELQLDEETYTLECNDVVRFDGDRTIEPTAIEDSEALLVFSPEQSSEE